MTAKVVYSLRADGGLVIDYSATTDAPTIVNLTNHAYFDLGGRERGRSSATRCSSSPTRFTPVDRR